MAQCSVPTKLCSLQSRAKIQTAIFCNSIFIHFASMCQVVHICRKVPQFLDIFCFKYKICTRNVCKVVLAGLRGVVQRMALNSHFTGKIIQRRKKSSYIKKSTLNTFGEIKGKILRNDENGNHLGKGSHNKSIGAF